MEWAVSWNPELLITHTNGISVSYICIPALVKTVLLFGNQQVTNALSKQVGTPEAIRPLTTCSTNEKELSWNQWLAGLIDGDGCLLISKAGYASCEITMALADEHALNQIKQKLGGSVKLRSGYNSIRYRLHHKEGMLELIHRINGHIRKTVRIEQLRKMCEKYNILFKEPAPIVFNNGWFAGFFDADGTITISIKNNYPQLTISASTKKKEDLLFFTQIFNGNIYFDKSSRNHTWSIQSKTDNLYFLTYIKKYPSRSGKQNRFHLVPLYYELCALKAYNQTLSLHYKAWVSFLEKWGDRR